MMRGPEIISAIAWSSDLHADSITEIEDAILALDRKAYGNNRPQLSGVQAFARLEKFIAGCKSASDAATRLGISKSFLSDIRNARRPIPPGVCRKLGIERRSPGRDIYLEI